MSSFSFSFFGENSNGKLNDLNGTLSKTNSAFGLIDLPRPLSSAPPNPGNAISIAAYVIPSKNVLPTPAPNDAASLKLFISITPDIRPAIPVSTFP